MPINYPDDATLGDDPQGVVPADVGLSLDLWEPEVRAGLPGHADRLQEAWDNEQFYRGKNAAYVSRKESEEYLDYLQRPKPTSKVTRKAIRALTADLYSPGPTRELTADQAVGEWLAKSVYEPNHVNALMQAADRKATLNATAAVMAVATGDPQKPVKLHVFGAHQFVIFPHPQDNTRPAAVCTIEKVYEKDKVRLRLELWSRDEHRVYLTKPENQTERFRDVFGCRADFQPDFSGFPVGSGVNPYGCLPFIFVHDEPPVTDFWEGGVGTILRELNREADRKLSQLSNLIDKYLDPDGFLSNVSPSFRREKRPGGWQHLTPGVNAEGDAGGEPKAFYVQPQLNVEQAIAYILFILNNGLEEADVPLVAVHSDASTDLSGIAIVAKHLPLLGRTKARQPWFTRAECELATLVLTVAGHWYGDARLLSAAAQCDLQLSWPEPCMPLPTPERDAMDSYEMEGHIKSLIDVVAERLGCTKPQARERILRVAEDNAWLAKVLTPAPPVAPADGDPPAPAPALITPAADPTMKGGNPRRGQGPAPDETDEDDDAS